jgi:ubiquinone biosynthesis protein UbiJ
MVLDEREKNGGKAMSTAATVQDLNRQLARQINEEARRNPQSPYANKFVGIANGQVVVVADSVDEMSRRLRQIEPDVRKCFGVEASRDYDEVHEIWELR